MAAAEAEAAEEAQGEGAEAEAEEEEAAMTAEVVATGRPHWRHLRLRKPLLRAKRLPPRKPGE